MTGSDVDTMDQQSPGCNTSVVRDKNCTLIGNISDSYPSYSGPEAVAVPVVFAIIFIAGMIGNAALLYYILRKRGLNSPHNIYVTNLVIGDMVMITVAMPFVSTIYTFDEWPYGEFLCKLSEFTHTFCTAVIIFTITVLSIERFTILTLHDATRRKKWSIAVVFVIWITSFVLALPDLISAEISSPGPAFCVLYRHDWGESFAQTMTLIKLLFLFIIPLCVIATFYVLIAYTLLCGSMTKDGNGGKQANMTVGENLCDSESNEEANRKKRRKKMAILVLCLIFIFFECWILRYIFLIWFHFDTDADFNEFWHVFKIVGFCLMYMNSAINPFAFVFLEPDFREFLKGCLKRQNTKFGAQHLEEYSSIPKQTIELTDITTRDPKTAV